MYQNARTMVRAWWPRVQTGRHYISPSPTHCATISNVSPGAQRVVAGKGFQAKKRQLTGGWSLDNTAHTCAAPRKKLFGLRQAVSGQIPFSLANTLTKQHEAS